MSNHYAIATVTATLQQLLNRAVGIDVSGASASMVRPDEAGAADPGVNVFLYEVSPNGAWRNEDLPTRNGDSHRLQRPRAAIDLHYLLTFAGSEERFESQRVLGSVVRELHDKPTLTRPQIEDAKTAFPVLAPSNLAADVELVKFTQLPLTLEEMGRLWSVFFQARYRLSVAYRGTVVLIEPEDSYVTALPVRTRRVYVETLREPLVEAVVAAASDDAPILAGAQVRVRGHRLGDSESVRVDGAPATLGTVTDTEVTATLPALSAGIHGLFVERSRSMGKPEKPHEPGVKSNVLPFVLAPKLGALTVVAGELHVVVDPPVGAGQRAALVLNELTPIDPHAYTFTTTGDGANPLKVVIAGAVPGTYLVRLQVDGATSPLDVSGDSYATPQVTL